MARKVSDIAAELADREAIRDCLTRVSRAIDRVDVSLGPQSCWPEGIDDHAGQYHCSFEEYWAAADEQLRKTDVTQHFLLNSLIEIDGDHASTETYVFAYHGMTVDGLKTNYIGGARYLDKLEKRDDEWRLIHRILVIDWMKNIADDPNWASDPIGGHYVGGQRKPDDRSMQHFKLLGR